MYVSLVNWLFCFRENACIEWCKARRHRNIYLQGIKPKWIYRKRIRCHNPM